MFKYWRLQITSKCTEMDCYRLTLVYINNIQGMFSKVVVCMGWSQWVVIKKNKKKLVP